MPNLIVSVKTIEPPLFGVPDNMPGRAGWVDGIGVLFVRVSGKLCPMLVLSTAVKADGFSIWPSSSLGMVGVPNRFPVVSVTDSEHPRQPG